MDSTDLLEDVQHRGKERETVKISDILRLFI